MRRTRAATSSSVRRFRESFCRVAAEAMLNGLPVAASDLEPLTDLVGSRRRRRLFPAGDVHAAAAALRRLAGDEHLRKSLGVVRSRARRRIRTEGGLEAIGQPIRPAGLDRPLFRGIAVSESSDKGLRFGVMCSGSTFPAWQAQALYDLIALKDVEPALLILQEGEGKERAVMTKIGRRLRRRDVTWATYSRLAGRGSVATKPVDLSHVLGSTPEVPAAGSSAVGGSRINKISTPPISRRSVDTSSTSSSDSRSG